MSEILGYGEDALTLWALKRHVSEILRRLDDKTRPSDCLIFYRPSFGRHSKDNGAVFGEFDAIVASSRNVYLIESKWDNLTDFKEEELDLRREQVLRHRVFAWYLTHWKEEYCGNWARFAEEQKHSFKFDGKTIPRPRRLLAVNLEFVLSRLLKHCKVINEDKIKNVLLFFYNGISEPSFKVDRTFMLIPIGYGKEISGNFISLFPQERTLQQKEMRVSGI